MNNSSEREGRAFILAWDQLQLAQRKDLTDLPDEADARPLVSQAQFLRMQRSNPLIADWTIPLWLLADFGDAYLRWVKDPHEQERWSEMFDLRTELAANGFPRELE